MIRCIKELLSSSKTKTLSSTRLLVVIGSLTMFFCIVYMVITKDSRLNDTLPYFIGGVVTLITGKVFQSKYENNHHI